jgi:GTP-binding protein LepA
MSKPQEIPLSHIRNFSIVAHIDHGKSTLADRILQLTQTVNIRDFRDQFLDDNEIERERGITIKAKSVALDYERNGERYRLNLIDTPGHVDFNYEVSRSMAACEGALLLVDACQGVQAQTMANAILALEADLDLIPVINKIDLPASRPEEVAEELEHVIGLKPEECHFVSAKSGDGVPELLEAVIDLVPPPKGDPNAPLQALIFDSVYDTYRGVVVHIRLINGRIGKKDEIQLMGTDQTYVVEDVGIFRPEMESVDGLHAGQVGYITASIKSMQDVRVGDTVTHKATADSVEPLPGYQEPIPMVFCGLYPSNNSDFNTLHKALDRLSLNDASFTYQPETSAALGFGFRCGFLGLLHMEIVQERLDRELNVEVIQTAPNVTYEVVHQGKHEIQTERIDNPSKMPEDELLIEIREPMAEVSIIVPTEYIGNMMKLCEERRGKYVRTDYLSQSRAMLVYKLPFAEIVFDFYDKLKSATRGYGTMDYQVTGYEASDLVKLRILVAATEVDALSIIVHKSKAEYIGRKMIQILRKKIPRHLFQIALQASIGKRVVAREDIRALAKNVTAKCYGGDISRKRKLLEKQKEGKKKMKNVGNVEIPQEAFTAVLTISDD